MIFDDRTLCLSGGLIGISAAALCAMRQTTMAFMAGILFVTTVNHWRDYRLGWRRTVDMIWVKCSILYTGIDLLLYGNEIQLYMYSAILLSCTVFYAISVSRIPIWPVFHMALHVYVAFFTPLLYSLFL